MTPRLIAVGLVSELERMSFLPVQLVIRGAVPDCIPVFLYEIQLELGGTKLEASK